VYAAWLCYNEYFGCPSDEIEVKIVFKEPEPYRYSKVIPISFNVLHSWSDKEERLYK